MMGVPYVQSALDGRDLDLRVSSWMVLTHTQIMWAQYEHPEVQFEGMALRFMDIRKRVYEVCSEGRVTALVSPYGVAGVSR